ncbi:PorV/PorQ family protein [candidate division KSB1 bacterium]|nr:PorV/PorQ family protein [candidate division KSB1 bacterium]
MKKITMVLFAGIVLTSFISLQAQDGEAGIESLFSIGFGARGMALGNASVAFPEDPTAFAWNPAGMVKVERKEFLFSHTTLFEDVQYNFIGYVHPTLNAGTFGFGISRAGTGGIREFDNINGVSIEGDEFGYWWGKLSIAYAVHLFSGISFGANFEANRQVLLDYSTNGFGLDAGLHYAPSNTSMLHGFNFGYVAVNAYSPRLKLGTESEAIPPIQKLGIARTINLRDGLDRWLFLFDYEWAQNKKSKYHFGTEYSLDRSVFFRTGFDNGEITFGGGLRIHMFQLDYANSRIGDAEYFPRSHRFSLIFHIGQTLAEKLEAIQDQREQEIRDRFQERLSEERKVRIEESLKTGQEYFDKGDYFNARLEFSRVLREDRNNVAAKRRLDMTTEKEQEFQKQREDSLLSAARERDQQQRDLDFVNQRFQDGNEAMQRGEFQAAIKKWEEALEVDPDHPTIRSYISQARNQLESEINRAIASSRAYMRQENLTEARRLLERAKTQAEGNPELTRKVTGEMRNFDRMVDFISNYQAGFKRYNEGQFAEAVPYFEKALETQPENERVRQLYQNARARSNTEESNQPPEVKRDVSDKIKEGIGFYRDGRYEEALRVWEEALELDPHNVRLLEAIDGAREKLETFQQ